MALTFLRHHRKKALSKSSAAAAAAEAPPPPPQQQQSTDDEGSLASEAPSSVAGGETPRSPDEEEEEKDSGICPDSGSDFSRQGSSDSSWAGKDGLEEADEEEDEKDSDDCPRGGGGGEECLEDDDVTPTGTLASTGERFSAAGFVSSATLGDDRLESSLRRNFDRDPEAGALHPPSIDESDDFGGSRDSLHEVQSPTVPPAPPPPALDLRGDHTTSSTTDGDRDGGDGGGVFGRWRRKKPGAAGVSAAAAPSKEAPNVIRTELGERRRRIERSTAVDYELRLPQGKATFYRARIGVAPEDTELGRMFRKRAIRKQSDEEEAEEEEAEEEEAEEEEAEEEEAEEGGCCAKDTWRPPVNRTDAKQKNFSSKSSLLNDDSKLERLVKSAENGKTEVSSDDRTTIESHSPQKTDDRNYENSFGRETTEDESLLAVDSSNCIVQENSNTVSDKSQREMKDSGENEKGFDAAVEDFDQALLKEEEEDNSPEVLLSAQTPRSISSPELSLSLLTLAEAPVGGPVGSGPSMDDPLSPASFSSEDVFDDDVIASSAQTVEERSKTLSQPLSSYDIITREKPPEIERKSTRLSFRHLVRSLISPLGKTKKATGRTRETSEQRPSSSSANAETVVGKMEFDDNWSIHDTIRDKNRNSSRSLRNVFDNYEVRSLKAEESVDFHRSDTKDHSVRSWKDLVEKSDGGGGESPSQAAAEPLIAAAAKTGPGPSSSSVAYLDSVASADVKPSAVESMAVAGRLSGKFRKSKSRTEIMEEIRSSRSSGSRLASPASSSGLNSTLPSRRNLGMMQSLDSIFPPASKLPTAAAATDEDQQRRHHYQKRHESEPIKKRSLPSSSTKAGSALLSPVIRRRLRSMNGKK